jgi:hypothetical protein
MKPVLKSSLLFFLSYVLGLPLTELFMLAALKYRSPLMFPLIVTGSFGFVSAGIWMIRSLIQPATVTDYVSMIQPGTPALLMGITGAVYILIGLYAFPGTVNHVFPVKP